MRDAGMRERLTYTMHAATMDVQTRMTVDERRVAIDVLSPSELSVEVIVSVVHGRESVRGVSVEVIANVGMV